MEQPQRVCWLAIGDWGEKGSPVEALAAGMAKWADEHPVDFVMGCGDNFYPRGVRVVDYGKEPWTLGKTQKKSPMQFDDFTAAEFIFWEETFLKRYPSLRVPWRMVLGNHDYDGKNWNAQVWFTSSKLNPYGGLWQYRGDDSSEDPSRNYTFTRGNVQFFAFDACASQWSTRRVVSNWADRAAHDRDWLNSQLKQSQAKWKIVFQHHPYYTDGRGHDSEALAVRSKEYRTLRDPDRPQPGLDLEKIIVANQVDVVISGHEHVMSFHRAGSVAHVGCGAAIESYFYQGRKKERTLDWCVEGPVGFVAFDVEDNVLTVQYIEAKSGQVVKQFQIEK